LGNPLDDNKVSRVLPCQRHGARVPVPNVRRPELAVDAKNILEAGEPFDTMRNVSVTATQ
jgi:hypothetical protein